LRGGAFGTSGDAGFLRCAIGRIRLAAARQKPYIGSVRGGASGRIMAFTAFHSNGFRHVRLTRATDRTASRRRGKDMT
jgi:hypothetical protein